jgi:hypothetical protein
MEVSGQLHAPAALPSGREPPRTRYLQDMRLVGPRTGLDDVERRKYPTPTGTRDLRPLSHPARRQLLHRVRYPGSKESAEKRHFCEC